MSGNERVEMIRQRLEQALDVHSLEIQDDSHKHAGHAGAQAGGGHYQVRVVSPDFAGLNTLQRHRKVYGAMGDAMRNDIIHALGIKALTPDEA
ncbi:BolA family protein [Alkalilimnicola ehrlichii MLHE-1]|uniref:Transcriptional regulator, BolA protein family n=1 Tax=Alkalilimnicola ehrlichii (strain ATCC BAA-1101 / DSM 17681 / MLHE-1) TaxID=187272 RepID=Q0AAR6_ALKEH|nr:BolA family protein [Alkalilimnicola ehrlichii]ABI56071.1 transcriptional regulator, BolA protein family [Alkalilimnicola ehrlichii MLHE-1]